MSFLGSNLIQIINRYAPPELAVEGDKIGLQIGSASAPVTGALIALDVTDQLVDEAAALNANWIIAHHPLIYSPLKNICLDNAKDKLISRMIKQDLNLYVAHTNLDVADGGVNDVLAELLELQDPKPLITTFENRLQKLVVFVPESAHKSVLSAITDAGAGHIGAYSKCTFSTLGTGTFYPETGSNPAIGSIGKMEEVSEIRLETIFPKSKKQAVLSALFKAHPYEEIAYDIYDLDLPSNRLGLGRVGNIEQPAPLDEIAQRVAKAYQVPGLRSVGDSKRIIKRIAVLGGSGSRYASNALQEKADLYITGDIDYHTAQDAIMSGLCLIDPGHHVEDLALQHLCDRIKTHLPSQINISKSSNPPDPFDFFV